MNQWFSCRRVKQVAHVRIGDDLGFFGPSVEDFALELGDAPEVQLVLDSNGGSVRAAFALYDLLRSRRTASTVFRAHSSAAIVAMAAQRIEISAGGSVMLHSARCAAYGPADFLREEALKLDSLGPRMVQIFVQRTRQPQSVVEKWLSGDGDVWFNAEQALEAGLSDAILKLPELKPNGAHESEEAAPTALAAPEPMSDRERFYLDVIKTMGAIDGTSARFRRELCALLSQNVR